MKEIKIVIITEKDDMFQNMKSGFGKLQGYNLLVEGAKLDGAMDVVSRFNPLITIIDLSENPDIASSLVVKITNDVPQTYLACTADNSCQELIVQAMRLGAKDYLKSPVNADELEQLIIRSRHAHTHDIDPSKQGEIITVFSNKGGAGTTSLAINLGVGLAKFTNSKVVVVDLVAQHGDVCIFLDVIPTYTITDLIENFTRLDKTFLLSALTKHPSGVHVLTESIHLEDADVVTGKHIAHILNMLKEMFDYVIVDGGNVFNEQTLTALDLSDKILLVTSLSIPSIQNTKRCLDIFRRLRYDEDKVKLIINRYNSKHYESKIDIEQAKKTLDSAIFWMLPNDYSTLIGSINRGEPILFVNQRSDLSDSLVNLIKGLTNGTYKPPAEVPAAGNLFKKAVSRFSKIIRGGR